MLFLVHEDDGRITQSNKHYNPEGYDKVLADHGHKFVKVDSPRILPPDEHYIHAGTVRPRQAMPITVEGIMRAGKSGVTFSGVPKPCQMTISVDGAQVHAETIVDGQAYLEAPVPGIYQVRLDAFPWLPWTADVECVA